MVIFDNFSGLHLFLFSHLYVDSFIAFVTSLLVALFPSSLPSAVSVLTTSTNQTVHTQTHPHRSGCHWPRWSHLGSSRLRPVGWGDTCTHSSALSTGPGLGEGKETGDTTSGGNGPDRNRKYDLLHPQCCTSTFSFQTPFKHFFRLCVPNGSLFPIVTTLWPVAQ